MLRAVRLRRGERFMNAKCRKTLRFEHEIYNSFDLHKCLPLAVLKTARVLCVKCGGECFVCRHAAHLSYTRTVALYRRSTPWTMIKSPQSVVPHWMHTRKSALTRRFFNRLVEKKVFIFFTPSFAAAIRLRHSGHNCCRKVQEQGAHILRIRR